MDQKLHLIYFSPTGTTRKIIDAIAKGFTQQQIVRYDLTYTAAITHKQLHDGVAIIGVPVYAGRVPEICLERIIGFTATNLPVILVALYGNREYEDTLIELSDMTTKAGFSVIAAGAFIGEHSYSTADQPIAIDRPDYADLSNAQQFGRDIALKLSSGANLEKLKIPGNFPYRERVQFGGISPTTDPSTCTLCGICASVCPTFIIKVTEEVSTDARGCVMCCACVKNCPEQARTFSHPTIEERRKLLIQNYSQRKEPSLFL